MAGLAPSLALRAAEASARKDDQGPAYAAVCSLSTGTTADGQPAGSGQAPVSCGQTAIGASDIDLDEQQSQPITAHR